MLASQAIVDPQAILERPGLVDILAYQDYLQEAVIQAGVAIVEIAATVELVDCLDQAVIQAQVALVGIQVSTEYLEAAAIQAFLAFQEFLDLVGSPESLALVDIQAHQE